MRLYALFPLLHHIKRNWGRVALLGVLCLGLSQTSFGQRREDLEADSMNLVDGQGRKQGVWRDTYGTGEVKTENTYKDGKMEGLQLTFHRWPNCIKTEAQYKNDTLDGYKIEYYPNCNIKLVENYAHGEREGFVRKYDKGGFMVSEGFYKKGKLDGTVKTFSKKDEKEAEKKPDPKTPGKTVDLEDFLTGTTAIHDSVILEGLRKLKPDKHTLIAADVTGSMYPYIGQLLLWYKMNQEEFHVENFVFFNDGDDRPDLTKKVGKVGGVYPVQANNDLLKLKQVMEEAISKGNGGDMQENDIEGILGGLKAFKKTDKIILVADRKSPVRDIVLLKKVKAPIYVLLCGAPEFTHIHYLNMAQKTGGAVYSLGEQWIDLKDIEEGQRLQIAHLTYLFRGGHFVRLKEE